MYHLFSPEPAFKREIIIANSKEQSKEIEKEKHKRIGGNSLEIEKSIQLSLFKNINNTTVELLFRIAISSSYSGLSDLKKWHNHKIISEKDWELISSKLKLPIVIK